MCGVGGHHARRPMLRGSHSGPRHLAWVNAELAADSESQCAAGVFLQPLVVTNLHRHAVDVTAKTNAMSTQKRLVLGGHGLTILRPIGFELTAGRNLRGNYLVPECCPIEVVRSKAKQDLTRT